ncbi:MAG: hypothetical protein O3C04_03455 [Crenarchaeota archaeon]|nr:hypothetical protein [Thermoproteota archaeon]
MLTIHGTIRHDDPKMWSIIDDTPSVVHAHHDGGKAHDHFEQE